MSRTPHRLGRTAQLFGWWYVCIGLGYALLALRSHLLGGNPWMTAIRWIIAAGFFLLGRFTLHPR